MKLLWLTKTFPYPSLVGDVIYSRHLIEGCARLGVQIHVICNTSLVDLYGTAPDLPGLTWQIIASPLVGRWRSLFSPLPNIASRFDTRQRRDVTLKAVRAEWDGIVFDSVGSLAPFSTLQQALSKSSRRPFLVHISHNHEATTRRTIARESTRISQKLAQYFDAYKTRRLEQVAVRGCDLLVVNTEEDWQIYEQENPNVPHVVVRPGYDGPRSPKRSWADVPRTAVVLGSYQWVAKRLNVESLLRAAAPVFPRAGIRLRVVGHMDETYRAHLAKSFPWADIVGQVEDVSRELEKARIGIIPEQAGGGFKHKLLNYAFGRVAIAGIEGAMLGADLVAGKHYISALDMPRLVDTIATHIGRDDILEAMTDVTFVQCEKRFDWADRCRNLKTVLERMTPRGSWSAL